MKWFEHRVDASNSNTVNKIQDRFGLKGYAWWFKLIELCSTKINTGTDSTTFKFHTRIVRQNLRISAANLSQFLHYCGTIAAVSHHIDDTDIVIEFPKIVEYFNNRACSSKSRAPSGGPTIHNNTIHNNITPTPLTKRRRKPVNKFVVDQDWFENLYTNFPHRTKGHNKALALKVLQRQKDLDKAKFEIACTNYANSVRNGDPDFVKAFENFCRPEFWPDHAVAKLQTENVSNSKHGDLLHYNSLPADVQNELDEAMERLKQKRIVRKAQEELEAQKVVQ